LLTGELARSAESLSELGAGDGFQPADVAGRLAGAPAELVAAVTACLALRPEDRPPSAAALARLLAPVAWEAETLSLPDESAEPATEILAAPPGWRARRWTARRLAAGAALVAAAVVGLAIAIALNTRGHASPLTTPHAVKPPATGTSAVDQARNLAAWLRQHSG
jgi:hypothetical protein